MRRTTLDNTKRKNSRKLPIVLLSGIQGRFWIECIHRASILLLVSGISIHSRGMVTVLVRNVSGIVKHVMSGQRGRWYRVNKRVKRWRYVTRKMSANKQACDNTTAWPLTLAETVAIMNGIRLVGQIGWLTIARIVLVGIAWRLTIDASVLIISTLILIISTIMIRARSLHEHASRQGRQMFGRHRRMRRSTRRVDPGLLCLERGSFLFVRGPLALFHFHVRALLPFRSRPPHFAQQPRHVRIAHVRIFLLDQGPASLTVLQKGAHRTFGSQWMLLGTTLGNVPRASVRTLFTSEPTTHLGKPWESENQASTIMGRSCGGPTVVYHYEQFRPNRHVPDSKVLSIHPQLAW